MEQLYLLENSNERKYMALSHHFAVIAKNNKSCIISSKMEYASLSDNIFIYIKDSLDWIHSNWCGSQISKGLSYSGFSYIEDISDIKHFEKIIIYWKELFELAPDEFYITGDYLLDDNKYEKILIKKFDVIMELSNLISICQKAIKTQGKILHNGI